MANFSAPFGEQEAKVRNVVDSQTWGHLFPKKGKHRGYIVFAKTAYGQTELLDAVFEKTDSSPWLYDAINNLINDFDELDDGVYIWRGYCYSEEILTRAACDEDDEDEYSSVVRLQGKIAGKKNFIEIMRDI